MALTLSTVSRRSFAAQLIGIMCVVFVASASSSSLDRKNMSRGRFLQWRTRPKTPDCPDGYVDATNGNAYHWECGKDCPGQHWSDSCCNCACVRRSELGTRSCGNSLSVGTSGVPSPPPPSQPSVSSVGVASAPSPKQQSSVSSGQSRQPTSFQVFDSASSPAADEKTDGVPTGVVILLVLLGVGGFAILCCAVAVSFSAPKTSRVFPEEHPADVNKPAQFTVSEKPHAMPTPIATLSVAQREMSGSSAGSRRPSLSGGSLISSNSGVTLRSGAGSSVSTQASVVDIPVRSKNGDAGSVKGNLLSTQDLWSTARSRSLTPRPGSLTGTPEVPKRARSASPRPRLN